MLRFAQHDSVIFSRLLSPGLDGPHPAFGTPLPLGGRGAEVRGGARDPRLAPWATRCRPHCGLNYSTNLWFSAYLRLR